MFFDYLPFGSSGFRAGNAVHSYSASPATAAGYGVAAPPSEEMHLRRFPKGSKYQMFEVSGSKTHTLNGSGDQSPQILGT